MLQAPEGMHRIGLCLDSLVHYLVTGPPPIGASFTDEVTQAGFVHGESDSVRMFEHDPFSALP